MIQSETPVHVLIRDNRHLVTRFTVQRLSSCVWQMCLCFLQSFVVCIGRTDAPQCTGVSCQVRRYVMCAVYIRGTYQWMARHLKQDILETSTQCM